MGMFGNVIGGLFGSGGGHEAQGYEDARGYLEPYRDAGGQALDNYQSYGEGTRASLDKYGNPADGRWGQIDQSPQDFYQGMMEGYEQSPQYQQQMENMQRAMSNAGAASGMTGSGSWFDDWQRNAYDIGAQDQDRWFGNMMDSDQRQLNYLGDYRNAENNYMNQQNSLANMGHGAAVESGNFAVGQGRAQDANNPWGNIAELGASIYTGGIPTYGGRT